MPNFPRSPQEHITGKNDQFLKLAKKLFITPSKIDWHPALLKKRNENIRLQTRNLTRRTPKSFEELAKLDDHYWIWLGHYHLPSLTTIYRSKTAVKYLYALLRMPILLNKYKWEVRPNDPNHPSWDVNPYKYHLPNKIDQYVEYFDFSANGELTEDEQDLLEYIEQGMEPEQLLEVYSREELDNVMKHLGKSYP